MSEGSPFFASGKPRRGPRLLAIADVHVEAAENAERLERLRPDHDGDWLIAAGDLGALAANVEEALRLLARRFETVVWVPGNHELWTHPSDPLELRGEDRYMHLVGVCRSLGVLTPEDPFPVWRGEGGPAVVAPMFALYDYSFTPAGARTKDEALSLAYDAGVVCNDEMLLHPDPYATRDDWCRARVAESERRLGELDPELPTVLVNHWPLVREPTRVLRHQEFAPWCGTAMTADWHTRFRAVAGVYGHLHIPRTTWHDGVRFDEVSLGYPREWQARHREPDVPRAILPPAERS